MDHRDHPPPERSRRPAQRITEVRGRFEWTRAQGTGPALSVLGDLRRKRVVELGCGGGHNLAHLVVLHGVRGVGIDENPAKIERARRTYGAIEFLTFIEAEAAAYLRRQPPASIDICLSIFGAFSFSDPASLSAGAANALRSGGLLAVTFRQTEATDLVIVLRRR